MSSLTLTDTEKQSLERLKETGSYRGDRLIHVSYQRLQDLTTAHRALLRLLKEPDTSGTSVDKNGKPIVLQDYHANDITGVQIGQLGHKLWVCIDGVAVLRVVSPTIELEDMRKAENEPTSI